MRRARASRPLGAIDPPAEPDRWVIEIECCDCDDECGGFGWLAVVVCICAVLHFASLGFAIAFGAALALALPIYAAVRR